MSGREADLAALEEYFLRSGLPHLAADYDPREDTLTRLRPALLVIFLAGLGVVLRPDWPAWARALAVLAGLGIAIAGLAAVNVLRRRPPLSRPERVGFVEAAVFVLAPAAAALALGEDPLRALWIALGSIGAAAVLYALTSLGVVSMLVHLGRAAVDGLATTASIGLRAMPPVLAVLLFLFLAAEVWQAFGLLEGWRFGSVLLVFALIGTGFLVVALRRERAELCAPPLGEQAAARALGTPAARLVERGVAPAAPPLERMARVNVTVALVVSLGARVVAVGAVIALFFLLFGILVVDEGLTEAWVARAPDVVLRADVSGRSVVLTEQLVRVSVLLGGFAALYFVVVASTEAARREEFVDDEIERLSRVMAAWTYYRGLLGTGAGGGARR